MAIFHSYVSYYQRVSTGGLWIWTWNTRHKFHLVSSWVWRSRNMACFHLDPGSPGHFCTQTWQLQSSSINGGLNVWTSHFLMEVLPLPHISTLDYQRVYFQPWIHNPCLTWRSRPHAAWVKRKPKTTIGSVSCVHFTCAFCRQIRQKLPHVQQEEHLYYKIYK